MKTYGGILNKNDKSILFKAKIFIIFITVAGLTLSGTGFGVGFIFMIPFLMFVVIIYSIFKSVKSKVELFDGGNLESKIMDLHDDNKFTIPIEFFDPDSKFKDVSKITELFKSKNGKEISYYDNGKPVYKK